jgi:hypothetical protein
VFVISSDLPLGTRITRLVPSIHALFGVFARDLATQSVTALTFA